MKYFYISDETYQSSLFSKSYSEGRKRHKKKRIKVKKKSEEKGQKDDLSTYDKARLARSQLSSVNRTSQEMRGWLNMVERLTRGLG